MTVIRAKDIQWDKKFHSKLPSLYVVCTVGGKISRQTEDIKDQLLPEWNAVLKLYVVRKRLIAR